MTMITKLINRIDFAFLITILATLSGFWMFNYNLIIGLSEYDTSVLPLSLTIEHYIVTVYIAFILYICFHKSQSIIEEDSSAYNGINDTTINLFLKTWPYVIILSAIICIVSVMGLPEDNVLMINMFVLLAFGILTMFTLAKSVKKAVQTSGNNTITKIVLKLAVKHLISIGLLVIGYIAFLLLMTNISIKITVETDKEFYTKKDKEIVLIVKRHGYLCNPFISIKEDDKFPKKVSKYGNCFNIPLDGIDNYWQDTTIDIEYENTLFWNNSFMKNFMNKKTMYKEIFYNKGN